MRRLRNARSGDAPILDKGLSSMLAWGGWGGGLHGAPGGKARARAERGSTSLLDGHLSLPGPSCARNPRRLLLT